MSTDFEDILQAESQNLESIREVEVQDWPGWVRLLIYGPNGKKERYRSPGGLEISNNRFAVLRHKFKGQKFIPEEQIIDKPKSAPVFFTRPSTTPPPKPPPSVGSKQGAQQPTTGANVGANEGPLDIPEAKPRPGKAQQGKATARELSDSFITTMLIATSLVALITQFPELAMQEVEAKSIAIPLANILERSEINNRFGKLIASSGDYQMLGYGLFLYLERVSGAVQARRQNVKQSRPTQSPTAAAAEPEQPGNASAPVGQPGLTATGNGLYGANLPYSSQGTGRVTPITRNG